MDNKNKRIHLSVSSARSLAEEVLAANGYSIDESQIIGDHLIDAALCGYEYSGLPKLLNAIEHKRAKQPRTEMFIVKETPCSVLYDAGNNIGMLALQKATVECIRKAKKNGIVLIGVKNSWMSGRSAYFVEMIAREDLVGIMMVGSAPQVAPSGGISALLGVNPIAFGLPNNGAPFIYDAGMTKMTYTDLALHARLGDSIPEGVAIDEFGNATKDPNLALKGALLYFGSHKGFGLALVMQALSMLTLDKNYGYLIIAFRPDLLVPLQDFKQELKMLIERVKSSPRQSGIDEIRIPSERAFREREARTKEGIFIDESIYQSLMDLR